MSISTGDHDVDEVLAALRQGLAEVTRLWQQVRKMLDSRRQGRTSIEDLLNRRNWDERMDRAIPRQEDQGQQAELAALEEYERSLAAQVREQQARIDELQRQRDQALNNDLDRDGIDDRVENRTDRDRDGIDDNVEADERTAEEIENDHDRDGDGVDDAVEDREEQRAEADAAREQRERDEQKAREQSEQDGVDPATAAGAAAGATVAAEELAEIEDERDGKLEADEPALDAHDPALGNEEQNPVDNAVEQTSDPAARTGEQTNEVQAEGLQQGEEQAGTREAGTQEADLAADGVDGQQNVVDWDTERDGTHIEASGDQPATEYRLQPDQNVSLRYTEGAGQDSPAADLEGVGQTSAGPDQQQNLGDIQGETFVVDQNGLRQGTENAQAQQAQVAQDGQQAQVAQDGQQAQVAQNGQQAQVAQAGQEAQVAQDGQQAQVAQAGQEAQVAQAGQEAQVDVQQPRVDVQQAEQVEAAEQGRQAEQAPEQGQQPQQVQGPNVPTAQDVADRANSAVDQSASLGADGPGDQAQGQAGQAQSQWRPPEQAPENKAIADARQGNQINPGPDFSHEEKAVLVGKTSEGHAPASGATDRDAGAGVNAGDRSARDRQLDRERSDRGAGRGNDGPGLSR